MEDGEEVRGYWRTDGWEVREKRGMNQYFLSVPICNVELLSQLVPLLSQHNKQCSHTKEYLSPFKRL